MRLPHRGSPDRFRYEKWFWCGMTAAVVACYVLLPAIWSAVSILYLAVVSNYALVATFSSAEQSAKAKNMADPDVP